MSKPPPSLDNEFSPALHFRAPFGWINDPNGLVFADGLWHLFYQFYPMSTEWGPMHWGHAVSEDLMQWKNLPIALAPDALGNIFSGSCVIDVRNDSGLFPGASDSNMLAFYTSSLPQADGRPDLQTQSVAWSTNSGVTWEKLPSNPIIGNAGRVCFRDQKVFWYGPGAHWVMVLTHGQTIGIYRSTDLLKWELASEFGEGQGHHSAGPWECPDLFELKTSNGTSRWVLVVGVGDGCPAPGSGTQYFVGSFDGTHFVSEGASDATRWLDLGRDHYATQSWFAAPAGRRVAIAWMSNWRYARNTRTRFFRGLMTLPRDLHLGDDRAGGHFVGQRFSAELDQAFALPHAELRVGESGVAPAAFRVRGRASLRTEDTLHIRLFDDDYDQFTIQRSGQAYEVLLERRAHDGDDTFGREFPHRYTVALPVSDADLEFDMIVDSGAVELLLDGGRHSITQLFFPRSVTGAVRFAGSASGTFALFSGSKE